ncbi:MAG: hypothetical protein J3K34DRAFT_160638 [Monoraphidium minutum]|nr:MAG: hypothetical protein J3K34DRAFT_160638 [Monoraphidium minutum]
MIPSLARSITGALGLHGFSAAAERVACAAAAAAPGAAVRGAAGQQQQQQRQESGGARWRAFSGGGVDVDAATNAINDAFSQAREDIADARDDAETVYFNESAALARTSVGEVLGQWGALLAQVPEAKRGELVRSMGLKMEQLKAELKELDDLHA